MSEVPSGSQTITTSAGSFSCSWQALWLLAVVLRTTSCVSSHLARGRLLLATSATSRKLWLTAMCRSCGILRNQCLQLALMLRSSLTGCTAQHAGVPCLCASAGLPDCACSLTDVLRESVPCAGAALGLQATEPWTASCAQHQVRHSALAHG